MLSDRTIGKLIDDGRILVTPYDPALLQPASLDVRLGEVEVGTLSDAQPAIDAWVLPPGGCALASTLETIHLPADIAARCEGRSSWGRRFLAVHVTAGFIDPGFHGEVTLELVNLSPSPIRLQRGVGIGQLSFLMLDKPARRPYGHPALGSRYQGQAGPTHAVGL